MVKRDYKCVRIPIDDILFVDCDKDYIRFHLEGRPNIRTLGNLKQLEERLPREKFKRVHRSFLANMTKFDTVDQQHITYGDQSIPISETYFEFIKKYLEDILYDGLSKSFYPTFLIISARVMILG